MGREASRLQSAVDRCCSGDCGFAVGSDSSTREVASSAALERGFLRDGSPLGV